MKKFKDLRKGNILYFIDWSDEKNINIDSDRIDSSKHDKDIEARVIKTHLGYTFIFEDEDDYSNEEIAHLYDDEYIVATNRNVLVNYLREYYQDILNQIK